MCVCVFCNTYIYCVLFVYLSLLCCSYFAVLCFFMFCSCSVVIVVLCVFLFVCTSVGLLPPGESPIAVSNNNNNNNKFMIKFFLLRAVLLRNEINSWCQY
jgi:hypothetical protein